MGFFDKFKKKAEAAPLLRMLTAPALRDEARLPRLSPA